MFIQAATMQMESYDDASADDSDEDFDEEKVPFH